MNDAFDLDKEIRAINEAQRTLPPASTLRPPGNGTQHVIAPAAPYDFEEMGSKIAEGMLQAAKNQLVEAENMLRQTEQFADDIRQRVANKAAELADMNSRLRVLGASIVTAHQVFCGEDKPKPS